MDGVQKKLGKTYLRLHTGTPFHFVTTINGLANVCGIGSKGWMKTYQHVFH